MSDSSNSAMRSSGARSVPVEIEEVKGDQTMWRQYKASLKRNLIIKREETFRTFMEILTPTYYLIILTLVKMTIPYQVFPALFEPHDRGHILYSAAQFIGTNYHVSPETPQVKMIMDAISRASMSNVTYYDSEDEVLEAYSDSPEDIDVALFFTPNPMQDRSYTIRFNPTSKRLPRPEQRFRQSSQCRAQGIMDGGLENSFTCPTNMYYSTGFIGLQYILDNLIIAAPSGASPNVTSRTLDVILQSFPKDEFVSNNLEILRSIVPLFMVLMWAQFILYMLLKIVDEKEKKIYESMKIMGLTTIAYWLSWLTIYFIHIFILATVCTIVLRLCDVFQFANMGLVFVLFILYGVSETSMAVLITPFFSKARSAGVAGNLLLVGVSLLFYLQVYLGDEIATPYFYLLSLLSPCAFCFAIDKILVLDVIENGLSMSNIWTGPGMPFAGSLIMLSIDIVLYMVLALYFDAVVPTEYGIREKPYFCLMPSFWRRKKSHKQLRSYNNFELGGDALSISSDQSSSTDSSCDDVEEVEPEVAAREAVVIRGYSKTFSMGRRRPPVQAVKDFSLTIYEGQITAILGHNGAGKTTLFNMLTGMTAPSSGTATVFGLNINDSHDLREIRSMTGMCPQHNILFPLLTPREHFMFFARIRGVLESSLETVVCKTLVDVDLVECANRRAGLLSGGQQRKVSIGIALIGDPRIIFLDEPTAGVDAYSRRKLWDLLKEKKAGKVILLTTHFMDEADILADRKAVMSKGTLRCCGSSLFLKNKFGIGYHLTVIADRLYDPIKVLQSIQSLIPDVSFTRHYGKEMSFLLPYESVDTFPMLFRLLDYQKKDLKVIEDYGISMTSLEEVFLKLNEEEQDNSSEAEVSLSGSSSNPHPTNFIPEAFKNRKKVFAIEDVDFEYSTWRAFRALVRMRWLALLREPLSIVIMLVFTLGMTVGSMSIIREESVIPSADTSSITFTPDNLANESVLIHNDTSHSLPGWEALFSREGIKPLTYSGNYSEIFERKPQYTAIDVHNFNIDPMKLKMNMTLVYNDSYLHSLPQLINLISNAALLQLDPSSESSLINTTSHMLPLTTPDVSVSPSSFIAPMLLGSVLTVIPTIMFIEMVHDREIKSRTLLRLNGVSFHLYFSTFFILIGGVCLVAYVGLLVIIQAFQVPSLVIPEAYATVALLYFMYLVMIMFYGASLSCLFKKASTARKFLPNIASTFGFMFFVIAISVDTFGSKNSSGIIVNLIFSAIFPFYIPYGGIYYINKVYIECSFLNTCSELTMADYCSPELVTLYTMCVLNCVIYYFVLRVADSLKAGGSLRNALFLTDKYTANEGDLIWKEAVIESELEDQDVKNERTKLSDIIKTPNSHPAVMYNVGKVYKPLRICKQKSKSESREAVKSVSLAVNSGEVLGLLGPNGAGKTTTLKMLTADKCPTRGAVWVAGGRVTSVLSPTLSKIGYCPQKNCLWKQITVMEHIQIYAEVRGVKESQMDMFVNAYLDGLQIQEHKNKRSKDCSGGTKRKLCYVISMIGKPSVVLLDEPSTGMDPRSKRFLWDSILASFGGGTRSAVLTTHSMEEADALCSRLGIMVLGVLRCIGSVQHLKNTYGGGYTLELKVSRPTRGDRTTADVIKEVDEKIRATFPSCAYEEKPFGERLVYKIKQEHLTSLAESFDVLQELKSSNKVVEYAFSQTTLEQVFLRFARDQEIGDTAQK